MVQARPWRELDPDQPDRHRPGGLLAKFLFQLLLLGPRPGRGDPQDIGVQAPRNRLDDTRRGASWVPRAAPRNPREQPRQAEEFQRSKAGAGMKIAVGHEISSTRQGLLAQFRGEAVEAPRSTCSLTSAPSRLTTTSTLSPGLKPFRLSM